MKFIIAFLVLVAAVPLFGQRNFDTVHVRSTIVADNIFMLQGAGGNIGVCSGENGIFVIDDQFAPLTEKIKTAIADATQSNAAVRFILNTHWHGDHTGGNENFGKAGTVIVAHENVRKRMSVEQFNQMFNRTTPPSPKDALPIVTFTSDVTFHLNGDDIHVFHVEPAHTDGDAVVHFTKANVIHTGDLFFTGRYPFIDLSSGGSVDGVIAASEKILSLCNAETKIIPGHGSLSDLKGLNDYHTMLKTVRDRIRELVDAGKSLDEVKTARPTVEFDDSWGKGFMNPDTFVEIVYKSLSKK
jgi:glyoxylase-like metal-dependent hydrolase (beta-lactamase superfamily II)